MEINKCALITICGRPNVGKSTLTNALVGEKIAIVSSKPQTTRNRITAIVNRNGCQLVLMDTPGFHKARTKLGDYMVNVVKESIPDVDLVLLLVEPIANIGPQETALLERIKASGCPCVLVINKIDTAQIFDFDVERCRENIRPLNPQMPLFPVSGKTGEGMEPFVAWLKERIHEGH